MPRLNEIRRRLQNESIHQYVDSIAPDIRTLVADEAIESATVKWILHLLKDDSEPCRQLVREFADRIILVNPNEANVGAMISFFENRGLP